MVKAVKEKYKLIGREACIPQRALEILNKEGKRTLKKNKEYSINIIYAVIDGRYEDYQVDNAFIKAMEEYTRQNIVINSDISRRASLLNV